MSPVLTVSPTYVSHDDWSTTVSNRSAHAMYALEARSGDRYRSGAAIAVLDDGHLVTPAHLVVDASEVRVLRGDGTAASATVIGVDPRHDVAVLKIAAEHVPIAVYARDAHPALDSAVAILGATALTRPVWQAAVVQLDARATAPVDQLMFRVDSTIEGPADGGAVVDQTGALVGMATVPPLATPGDGLVVPAGFLRAIVADIVAGAPIAHISLGFEGGRASGLRENEGAVRVFATTPGASELYKDDVIISFDGQPATSMIALLVYARERGAGSQIAVEVLRKEVPKRLLITVRLS